MPALFLLLLLLVGYAMGNGEFTMGIEYLFKPDFSKLTGTVVLEAMGQAFFSLSLGMGAIMIYGSYLSEHASIARATLLIATMDTLVAILAGMAIFPIVFAYGLEPTGGPGLIFKVLPMAFGQMPGGSLFGSLFFTLLVFAAWTSAISLLEPIVTWLVENRGMNRVKGSAIAGVCAWGLGVVSLLSLNVWSQHTIRGLAFFDLMDFLTANIMLPLGGVLIAVFVGWRMARGSSVEELAMGDGVAYRTWYLLIRFVAPAGVSLVLVYQLYKALAAH
jgi:NSS family neurotransmitter:Na+ symporter